MHSPRSQERHQLVGLPTVLTLILIAATFVGIGVVGASASGASIDRATAKTISLAQKSEIARSGRTHVVELHRGKHAAVCQLKVTSPSGVAKRWRYPKGRATLSFAFRPTRHTRPGTWKLAARCVPSGSVSIHRASAKLRVRTGRHGSAFLVGKRGPQWVALRHQGQVNGAPPVIAGGRGGDPGDDYPWKNVPQDSGLDPWREYYRECTSFVAWALHSRNNFNMPFFDDAYNWGIDAQRLGYPVNDTPAVGAVAWEPKLPNHQWGHVMWVSAVNGNRVTVEEYNEYGNGTYDQRTFTLGSEPYHFIHFKDISSSPPTVTNPTPPTSPPAGSAHTETTGGVAATWTNYVNAGGTQGPSIAKNQSVTISCKIAGFRVADGNTWWYQIASSPWSNSYYVSADAFYNNGQTSGSLVGTPFVDSAVPDCGGGGAPSTWAETVGGVAHTWTNYTNAGGTQGASIAAYQTVQITCRLQGFTVADGNNWWYRIASSPWNNAYYVSADAFYNNGATSGSLHGTPFVDTAVATC